VANEIPWPLLGLLIAARSRDFAYSPPATRDVLDDWLDFDIGDRLDRINALAEHPTEDVRLEVEGYTETIRHRGWAVQLNAEPFDPWDIGVLADGAGTSEDMGRLAGDAAAAIRVAVDSDDLSFAFDPNVYRWTTAVDHFSPDPLRVRVGGEVVEVGAITTTAASFVAAGAMSSADNAAVTPALYAGGAANDWIVCVARIREASNGVITINDGLYSRLSIQDLDADSSLQVWVKVHTGSEAAPIVTPSGGSAGDTVSAFTFGLRNMPITWDDVDDVTLGAPAYRNASGQNIAYPGQSVMSQGGPVDGAVVVVIGGKDDDWTSVATLTGYTEALDSSTTTGNDQGLVMDYLIQTTAAVVPDGTFTVTGGASAVSTGVTIVFAGGFQTMTVTARSVNGVVKSHAAGTLLEVNDPLVLGL